jgi:hypothetical protein
MTWGAGFDERVSGGGRAKQGGREDLLCGKAQKDGARRNARRTRVAFAKGTYRVRPDGKSCADLANAGSALDDERFNTNSLQRHDSREAADSCSNNYDAHVTKFPDLSCSYLHSDAILRTQCDELIGTSLRPGV